MRSEPAAPAPSGSRVVLADALLVLGVAALLILPPLGHRVIVTSHEARFAVLAQDMLARRAWLEARVGGKVYRNKPPLFPWSIAALSAVHGRVTEASAEAPVALAALATVLATFFGGRRLFGRRAGRWAGLILATSYDFVAHSQLILPDMLMVACVAAASFALWRSVSSPEGGGRAMVACYAAVALAVFAKGPVGLLPLLIGAAWLCTEQGLRGLGRLWSPVGLGLFGLITLAWLVPFLAHGSQSFALDVVQQDWLEWFLGLPSPRFLSSFLVESALGMLPWTFVLPVAVVAAVRQWREPVVRFVLLWLGVPVILIALSHNPRARYLLPIYPAAALLIAWWADRRGTVRTGLGRALSWISLAAVIVAVTAPLWSGLRPGPLASAPWWAPPAFAVAGSIVGAALFIGLGAGRPALLVLGTVAPTVALLTCGSWLYTGWVNRTYDFPRVAEAVARRARGQEPAAYFNRDFFQVDFYARREIRQIGTVQEFNAFMARPERPVALVNGRNWDFIAPYRLPELGVLDRLRVGDEDLLIVQAHRADTPSGQSAPAAKGARAG